MGATVPKFTVTAPKRLARDMHTCEGLLRGIAPDGLVSESECDALVNWLDAHHEFARRKPFCELIDKLWTAVRSGFMSSDVQQDLLWVCQRFSTSNAAYDAVASSMQRLQGYLAGVISDATITEEELQGLREWADEHAELRGLWPYDEVDSLITAVMADGKIDAAEHEKLLSYFADFSELASDQGMPAGSGGLANFTARGVCAVDPAIDFEQRLFCFTGESARATREEMAFHVESRGGHVRAAVSKQLDYLVIGAAGSPCWAFACYGRKVEQAVALRRAGERLLIVHENDFWDAVA
ncbi:MAG: BRCT domain-containing protein [Planctomycetota bacterium]